MAVGDVRQEMAKLLDEGDQRQVQEIGGGGSIGISLPPDKFEKGDTVFLRDTNEENVYELVVVGNSD
jgi:hypothetical protein